MLKYVSAFNPQRLKDEKQARVRILDSTPDGKLLVQINTPKHTSIELVNENGECTTAVSFNKYMDFINANLSNDNELLHLVERIPSPKGFCFSSRIMHIFGSQVSREIISEHPITGKFININPAKGYQMLHIMGTKLTHLHITLNKTSISWNVIRGGINIPTLIAYHYFRDTSTLTTVYLDDKIYKYATFHFREDGVKSKPPINITVNEKSALPPELALNASSQMHLPIFRAQLRRFFFEKCNGQVFIIQQLYDRNTSNLSFNVLAFPKHFSQIVSVPGVSPDHPICSLHFSNLLIVFAPNLFVIVIDMSSTPPIITSMPSSLSISICGSLASNIPIKNAIVDINTNEIFKVSIDVKNMHLYERSFDRFTIPTISMILARQMDVGTIVSLIESLTQFNDRFQLLNFIQCFHNDFVGPDSRAFRNHYSVPTISKAASFSSSLKPERIYSGNVVSSRKKVPEESLSHMEVIDTEFPSASSITRVACFKRIFTQIANESREKSPEDIADKAFKVIRRQNSAALCMRTVLDQIASEKSFDQIDMLTIKIAVATETINLNLPSVACLASEIAHDAEKTCSNPIKTALSSHRVTGRIFPAKEATHWRKRIPQYIFDAAKPGNSTSSGSDWSSSIASSSVFIPRSHSRKIGSSSNSYYTMSVQTYA